MSRAPAFIVTKLLYVRAKNIAKIPAQLESRTKSELAAEQVLKFTKLAMAVEKAVWVGVQIKEDAESAD